MNKSDGAKMTSRKRAMMAEASRDPEGVTRLIPVSEELLQKMNNPYILTRIFEQCDLWDLSRLRLVSKTWYELALPRWRSNMNLVIKDEGSNGEDYADHLEWKDVPMLWKDEDFRKFASKPYRRYKLHDVVFDGDQYDDDKLNFYKFRDNIGPFIHKLELVDCDIDVVNDLKRLIFMDTPQLKDIRISCGACSTLFAKEYKKDLYCQVDKLQENLERFEISIRVLSLFPLCWRELFSLCPNIKSIMLGEFHDCTQVLKSLVETLEYLSVSKTSKVVIKSLHLRDLKAPESRTDLVERLLSVNNVKLEELWFLKNLSYTFKDLNLLLPVALSRHKETLKKIQLPNDTFSWLGRYENFLNAPTPYLAMKEIKIGDNVVTSLDFLRQTPNLSVLHIGRIRKYFPDTNYDRFENYRLDGMVDFRIDASVPADKLVYLGKLFPNLQRLCMVITAATFPLICRYWKDLRILAARKYGRNAYPKGLKDKMITGGTRKGNSNPLTDLQYLRILHLADMALGLGDDSIYGGFLQLPCLQILCVKMSPSTSDEAMDALHRRFPGSTITRA